MVSPKARPTARIVGAALLAALFAAPAIPASAQGKLPSYATSADQQKIRGTISGFDGAYTMYVRDVRGYIDNIQLHQGTVINPTGLRLQPGMSVTVYGRANGPWFAADVIDTPYHFPVRRPYPGYYPGYYYPGYFYPGFFTTWYGPTWFGRVGSPGRRWR